MTRPQISARNLGVTFPAKSGFHIRRRRFHAIRDVSFDIGKKDTFCLIGESGSGKTTLINALLGFQTFQEGKIVFDGEFIAKSGDAVHRRLRAESQLVFQDPAASLSPFLTLRQSMEEPLRAKGLEKKERFESVNKLADQVGLPPQALGRTPAKVSGGQSQRACIARALSVRAKILFLDEPLSALDMPVQKQVAELLLRIKERHEITFFLVTHDLGFVKKIGTDVAVMYLGRIVEKAPKRSFFSHPRHPYSQALLSSVLEPGVWSGSRIVLEGEIPSPIHPPSGCVFHPRCFRRLPECETIPPPRKIVDVGHEVFCHLY